MQFLLVPFQDSYLRIPANCDFEPIIDFPVGDACDCGVCDMRVKGLIEPTDFTDFHPGMWDLVKGN